MKRFLILIFCVSFFSLNIFAQSKHYHKKNALSRKRAPNALYLDVFGTGILPAISYERILYQHRYLFINARIGIGYSPETNQEIMPAGAAFSHSISINRGENNRYFELGIGGSLVNVPEILETRYDNTYVFYPIIGYRRQTTQGFLFRIYFNPLGTIEDASLHAVPFGGMSLGFSF